MDGGASERAIFETQMGGPWGRPGHGEAMTDQGAPPPPDTLVGQLIDGRWKIIDRLGEGGMGVVYRAERIKLGKLVAIKFLDGRAVQSPESVARFEREARAISRVQHRHSVSILDFGVHLKRPYIVMEHLSGHVLSTEMGKPQLTLKRAVTILSQMLEALRNAHESGVVHRDLKPDNVMLIETTGPEDYVKILDFGLAKIIAANEPSISLPQVVAGTPSYMSPEQARGEKADPRSDLYSAGVILYGMCVGRKPFRSNDTAQMLEMHRLAQPPPPRKTAPERNLSVELERVILRALEKRREDRFQSADEFLTALKATPEAGAAPTVTKPPKRRMRRLVGALALLSLGAGGALAALTWLPARLPPAWRTALTSPSVAAPIAQPTVAAPPPSPKELAPPSPSPKAPEPTAAQPVVAPPGLVAAPPVDLAAAPDLAPAPKIDAAAPIDAAEPPATVEQAPAPAPAPAPATTETRVNALLDADKLADAERLLLAEQILSPRAAWVHLDLGEVYVRRLWRADAEREWAMAIKLDPVLKHDPRLTRHLCATLGRGWKGAGERFMVSKIGADAVEPMLECIHSTDDAEHLRSAVRVIERVGGRSRLDRGFIAQRLGELSKHR